MKLLVVLDPITSLLFHLFHDLIALITYKILLHDFPSSFKIIHELHAGLTSLFLGLSHLFNGVAHLILYCHWATSHAKEVKLFLTQLLDLLARQNAFNAFLNEKGSSILLLFCGLFFNKAFTNFFVKLSLNTLLLKRLNHEHDTIATLTPSLILLNQTDSIGDTELN